MLPWTGTCEIITKDLGWVTLVTLVTYRQILHLAVSVGSPRFAVRPVLQIDARVLTPVN